MSETFRAKVKPLEWDTAYVNQAQGLWSYGDYDSWSEGYYRIKKKRAPSSLWYAIGERGLGLHPSKEHAKAACQRDHEARVKALLQIEE